MAKAKKLAIGCPVFERAWCLPLWFDCLDAQSFQVDEIALVFAYSKGYDGTFDILQNRGNAYNELMIYQFDLPTFADRSLERFVTLAQLRNALLDMAKETDADYFLSWDDDVLFRPNTMPDLLEISTPNTAVGALIDMGGNDKAMAHPSVMHFPQAPGEMAYRRPFGEYDWSQPFETDIIMAVKLMGKEVYQNAKYSWDPVGEDIAWCQSCANLGYKRFIQPSVRGLHVYDKTISIEVMKQFSDLEYPNILGPLSRWQEDPHTWNNEPW